jgi:putative ABC transport system permease protein
MKKRERMMKDLEEDIREHIETETQDNIARGMSPEEAHYAAIRKFGNVMRVEEDTRDVWSFVWLEQFGQDIHYAFRMLRKSRGFTAVAVLTLALAIGATTAIFSVVYGVLLQPLPYTDSNRIMSVFEVNSGGTWSRVADPNFDDFRDQSRSFQSIAKYHADIASVSGASEPTRTTVAAVSPGFLKVLGVQPILGRDFGAGDAKKGAGPTVLVSYGYWRQYLGSSRDLAQSHLKIDGGLFSIVGVLPSGFPFPC